MDGLGVARGDVAGLPRSGEVGEEGEHAMSNMPNPIDKILLQ